MITLFEGARCSWMVDKSLWVTPPAVVVCLSGTLVRTDCAMGNSPHCYVGKDAFADPDVVGNWESEIGWS